MYLIMKLLFNKQRHRLIDLIKRDLCEATLMATRLYISSGISSEPYRKYVDDTVLSAIEEAYNVYGRRGVLAIDNDTTKCTDLMVKAISKVEGLRPGERCVLYSCREIKVVKTTDLSK